MTRGDLKADRLREFLAEAEDVINAMGKGLVKLSKGVKAGIIDPNVLNDVFRSAHTLKGMSGMLESKEMASTSHSLEDALDALRLGKAEFGSGSIDALFAAHDFLLKIVMTRGGLDFKAEGERVRRQLDAARYQRKDSASSQIDKQLLSMLTEYEAHRLKESLKESRNVYLVTAGFPVSSFDKDYLLVSDKLRGAGELIATLPSSRGSEEQIFFDMMFATVIDPRGVFDLAPAFVTDLRVLSGAGASVEHGASSKGHANAPPQATAGAAPLESEAPETLRRPGNTVRVNIKKLDSIMNIISELGFLKSGLSRVAGALRSDGRHAKLALEVARMERAFERKIEDLRAGVLSVRMVPIGQLFGRFDTFINRLAREACKELRIVCSGEQTELDKLIVEELADPLMHLIRNIVDHAIEPSCVRERTGKCAVGTITLKAYHKGNHAVIEVSDDGAGIDEEAVRRKAVERGIVSPEVARSLGPQEALDLIFLPGFSTKDVVSQISGRGVGLDVVKENITRLSGIIDIRTEKGKGTTFTLMIPITLAIIQALVVEEGKRRYALPLNSVMEIVEFPKGLAIASDYMTVNDRVMPCASISGFFGIEPAPRRRHAYGVVAGLAEHRLCLLVDSLVEEQDLVIKPLPGPLEVEGVAGATELGDETILVLDVTGIVERVLSDRKLRA